MHKHSLLVKSVQPCPVCSEHCIVSRSAANLLTLFHHFRKNAQKGEHDGQKHNPDQDGHDDHNGRFENGNGRIDAVICDSNVATYYANVKEEYKGKLHVAYKTSEVEHLGFCLQKNDVKLQTLLNEGLEKLRANGKMAELVQKWMGE